MEGPGPFLVSGTSLERLQLTVMKGMLMYYWGALQEQHLDLIYLHEADNIAAICVLHSHPDYYTSKRGCGVECVFVSRHKSSVVAGPSFFVKRICGSTVDFALKRCYSATGALRPAMVLEPRDTTGAPRKRERSESDPVAN